MKRAVAWIDRYLEEAILIVLLMVITVVMFIQIVMRVCFGGALPWPEEVCRYCFIYSGFLSAGYCIRRGKMLKVDILLGLFPGKIRIGLDFLGRIITLVYFSFLTYHSIFTVQFFVENHTMAASIRMPMYVIYFSTFLGFLLGTIRQIQDLIDFAKKNFQTQKRGDEI